jgi:hypothetical protein
MKLSDTEHRYSAGIHAKLQDLREFFTDKALDSEAHPAEAYSFLSQLKAILGNLNNDISFVAPLMAKEYLSTRFDMGGFDAAAKAQGAPGIDIEVRTPDGKRIAAEVKTTFPYQAAFGAKQREMISKDIAKLKESNADTKFLLLTERLSFEAAKKNSRVDGSRRSGGAASPRRRVFVMTQGTKVEENPLSRSSPT